MLELLQQLGLTGIPGTGEPAQHTVDDPFRPPALRHLLSAMLRATADAHFLARVGTTEARVLAITGVEAFVDKPAAEQEAARLQQQWGVVVTGNQVTLTDAATAEDVEESMVEATSRRMRELVERTRPDKHNIVGNLTGPWISQADPWAGPLQPPCIYIYI